jgi:hypothetical protein
MLKHLLDLLSHLSYHQPLEFLKNHLLLNPVLVHCLQHILNEGSALCSIGDIADLLANIQVNEYLVDLEHSNYKDLVSFFLLEAGVVIGISLLTQFQLEHLNLHIKLILNLCMILLILAPKVHSLRINLENKRNLFQTR